jgi:hypothetical protein
MKKSKDNPAVESKGNERESKSRSIAKIGSAAKFISYKLYFTNMYKTIFAVG